VNDFGMGSRLDWIRLNRVRGQERRIVRPDSTRVGKLMGRLALVVGGEVTELRRGV
jgi:hypothetical protein